MDLKICHYAVQNGILEFATIDTDVSISISVHKAAVLPISEQTLILLAKCSCEARVYTIQNANYQERNIFKGRFYTP